MFYKMITTARDSWYASPECTINTMIDYIVQKGQMRDAQIDAIKTYLYLKIACDSQPLSSLFSSGKFNNLDLDELSIPNSLRQFLIRNPAAAALFEYATLTDDSGKQVSEKLEAQIRKSPDSIDYDRVFENLFYGVSYTDYLFSLPMGAGKTFLMAAFIYLDLYFASNEPNNKSFAHNFIILVPSGLKTSVVPSLRTIQKFDPSWILPEPAASNIKRKLIFEVLDQNKTSKKSNKTKNPNVQKIANYQPFSALFGLVVVTNAEKVILDGIEEKGGQVNMFEDSDDERERQANELRFLLGKLPSLSIFIDEVHHAVSNEIKLRAVVNRWEKSGNVNSVIGFSGTPYLEKPEKIKIVDTLSIGSSEISNVVYYYPLIRGIGNFLKIPTVKISTVANSSKIIEAGVREFLGRYINTVYIGGLTAKLAIYCGSIKKLEEDVYPLVRKIAAEYGLADNSILRFYRKSTAKSEKQYTPPADSQMLFDTLDSNISPIRIILLVQIGKEGWDCRSLTGIILSQEGDCPQNMVLQTSCRCLRQVERNTPESALIYLNEYNAKILTSQLAQQEHITLQEFQTAEASKTTLKRYDRTKYLQLPKLNFYQMRVQYETVLTESANPACNIPLAVNSAKKASEIVTTTDFTMQPQYAESIDKEQGDIIANFNAWIYSIVKTSFGTISFEDLEKYNDILRQVFKEITYKKENEFFFSSKYDIDIVNSNIRKAFSAKRDFLIKDEEIPEQASLLNIANFNSIINTDHPEDYFPDSQQVENIIKDDNGEFIPDHMTKRLIAMAEEMGRFDIVETLKRGYTSIPNKDRSFHYLPYHSDSNFEQKFLFEMLTYDELVNLNLEIYYNGDKTLTDFKIKCYQKVNNNWNYIGLYTPDFLIIQRRDGEIYKIIIVETKGQIYANDPKFKDRKKFMETMFIPENNRVFGYKRFEYLYLEDTLSESQRFAKTHDKIKSFFQED